MYNINMNLICKKLNKLRLSIFFAILTFLIAFFPFGANATYVKPILPLYVETFAGFFKGVSGNAPSGVANFTNKQGSLTVSGTAGASSLTIDSINEGALADYGGTWAAIIDFGDGTYQILNATNVTETAVDIFPTLSQNITSVNMGNLHDAVNGQHLTSLGYKALADYVYDYDRSTALKSHYADIHGWAGTYYTSSWQYGAEFGTPFTLTGGLVQGGTLLWLSKGLYNFNGLAYSTAGYAWTGADRTGYYSNGDARDSVAGNVAGQGVTKTASLGGKSGFFESFVGIGGQAWSTPLPGRIRAQLWVDDVLVYDQTFSSLRRIAVPYENATTSTFTVTLADSVSTGIGIGQTTWWTNETDEASAGLGQMIPVGSSVMVYMDSWGTFYDNAFATELAAKMTADSGGNPIVINNQSLAGSTAATQLTNYDTNVLPLSPDYVIINYAINDYNGGLNPSQYKVSIEALIQHIVDSGSIPIVLGGLVTANTTQTVSLVGNWSEFMANTPDIVSNLIYDTTAPTVPGTPSTESAVTNNEPTWNWTASTDSESGLANPAYTVEWSQDSNFEGDTTGSATVNTNSYTHSSALADGTWYFHVKATDADGNASSYSANSDITIDTTAPILSETTAVATPTSDTTPDYTFSTTEAGTITYGGSCTSATLSATLGDNTITFSAMTPGAYSNCTITVTDTALNVSSALPVTTFQVGALSPSSGPAITTLQSRELTISHLKQQLISLITQVIQLLMLQVSQMQR